MSGVCPPKAQSNINFVRTKSAFFGPESFSIEVRPSGITVRAGDEAGMRYARQAVSLLRARGKAGIRAMRIDDWPDFRVRGVILDISRDKVPTMATLKWQIDRLSLLRINHLQLYTEHTFAYRGHERVWEGASPMTAAEIESLDRFCRARGIELVPNQNSFGHTERWLQHEPYRDLAETVGPWKTPWGTMRTGPTTLNPLDPRSLRLVCDLYDQLLPHFSSRLFNVGCDETFELGQGRSARACRSRGVGRVYLDYLLKLHREVRRRGHVMMFWADMVNKYSKLIRYLPRDVIPLVWGYEAGHPFDRQCRALKKRRVKFYVCPGTSSWCSFSGRTRNALANLKNAALAGKRAGAAGYLITDWGDYGHRQYLPASFCGFLYGAAVSWCADTNANIDVRPEISRHFFGDQKSPLGPLWLDAGRVHEPSKIEIKNRTILFELMDTPLERIPAIKGLSLGRVKSMHSEIEGLLRKAKQVRPGGRTRLPREELMATLAVLAHAAKRGELALSKPAPAIRRTRLRELEQDMRGIIATHRRLWLARNRPGGLSSSTSYFNRSLGDYTTQ